GWGLGASFGGCAHAVVVPPPRANTRATRSATRRPMMLPPWHVVGADFRPVDERLARYLPDLGGGSRRSPPAALRAPVETRSRVPIPPAPVDSARLPPALSRSA